MCADHFQRVAFGSAQERKLFPGHFAPDRLGIQMSRQQMPYIGPGSYDNHEYRTMLYNVQKTPGSRKGLARTAARFPPRAKSVTPSPQHYQQNASLFRPPPPSKIPFSSTTPRFQSLSHITGECPGPGTYAHDVPTNRKVSWPMCFGRPDWSRLRQSDNKLHRGKLNDEKEYLKQRSRVAHLSLYYNSETVDDHLP